MLPFAVVGQGFDSTIQKDDADEKNDENDSEHGKNNQKQIRLLRKIVVYSLIEKLLFNRLSLWKHLIPG